MSSLYLGRQVTYMGKGKQINYLPVYEKHLSRFKHLSPVILEIGVADGNSMMMWQHFFGPDALIVGIDINPQCLTCEDWNENRRVFIGDQSDPEFLKSVLETVGPPDVVIDDGSHDQTHVRKTFEYLYPRMTRNGVYIVEDLHMAYEDGVAVPDSFIEYSKNFADEINAGVRVNQPNPLSMVTMSLHFYMGMAIYERGVSVLNLSLGLANSFLSFKNKGMTLLEYKRGANGEPPQLFRNWTKDREEAAEAARLAELATAQKE